MKLQIASLGLLGIALLGWTAAEPNTSPASYPTVAPVHCQVPCGIYSDKMRIEMLLEDCATIEKAMTQLASDPASSTDRNQMVRWTLTKEDHAQAIQERTASYWLAQRIKAPADPTDQAARDKYYQQLSLLHGITVEAMKCKQTLDVAHVQAIRDLAHQFSQTYFSKEDLEHLAGHAWK